MMLATFNSAWSLLSSDHAGPFNPIDFSNPSLLFWTAVVFVILLTILTTKVWKPLMRTIDAREAKIRGDIEAAEAARHEADAARARHVRDMEEAALKAKALLDQAEARAQKLKSELEAQARAEAESILVKARAQIQAEKIQALQEIRDQVVDLSMEVTRRVVSKVGAKDDFVREVDSLLPGLKGLR